MLQIYNEVDQKLHQLSQIIAKFNRSFVPKMKDDSHTNLQFDTIGNRILGRWISTQKGNVIIGLEIDQLRFTVFDQHWKVVFETSAIGKSQMEIEDSFKPFCVTYNLSFELFKAPLHFDITPYSFIEDKYDLLPLEGLLAWKKWRSIGFEMCAQLLKHLQVKSEIRIWPHHFDTGIYTEVNDVIAIGFGLAMKDEVCITPYFYFSAYTLNDKNIDYDSFDPLQIGTWKIHSKMKGAVLEIEGVSKTEISLFIHKVAQAYLNY